MYLACNCCCCWLRLLLAVVAVVSTELHMLELRLPPPPPLPLPTPPAPPAPVPFLPPIWNGLYLSSQLLCLYLQLLCWATLFIFLSLSLWHSLSLSLFLSHSCYGFLSPYLSFSLHKYWQQIFTAISIDFVLILGVDFLFVQVMLIVVSTLADSVDIVVVVSDICSLICLIIAHSVHSTLWHVCSSI